MHADRWRGTRRAGQLGLTLCTVLSFFAGGAGAEVRFISSTGDDANPCTQEQPCRNLAAGIAATPAGGELQILDSGEYVASQVLIDRSMTISGVGVSATIRNPNSGTNTVIVNDDSLRVVLRHLHFTGEGVGTAGILAAPAASVHIEHCVVERFTGAGISVFGKAELFVTDTVSRSNGWGVTIHGDAATTSLTATRSRFENNALHGVKIGFAAGIVVTDSIVAGNGVGFYVESNGGPIDIARTAAVENGGHGFDLASLGDVTLEAIVARGNGGAGLRVPVDNPGVVARISNSVFTSNGTGIFNNGNVLTRGNNTIAANGTDLAGNNPLTPMNGS